MTDPITIYGDSYSAHCDKVRFLVDHLRIPYRWNRVSIEKKETQSPDFLAINPAGELPVMVRSDGAKLAQSNAILLYLAEGTDLLPADALDQIGRAHV